jgi:hypothetical protein
MRIEYTLQLAKDDALERLRALGEYLNNRHHIAVTWHGERATFSGRYKKVVKIAGDLSLDGDKVVFSGEDPGFALRGQATKYIRGKLDAYLDPAIPVDALARR